MIRKCEKESFDVIQHDVDLCVVGGGLAGMFAAIAAARHGATVVLMQDRPVLGGNASSEIRMWVRGAHGENVRETGLLEEVALENMYRNPGMNYSIWDSVLYEKAAGEKNITLLLNCSCCEAETEENRIHSVKGWQMTTQQWHLVKAKIFADCSGDSVLAPLTGAAYRMGREAQAEFGESIEPEESDNCTMGMTCLLQARETDKPTRYIPPKWAHKYTEKDFPHRMDTQNPDAWKEDNFWWMELGGVYDSIRDTEKLRDELLKIAFGVWDFVKNGGCVDADHWELEWVGFLPGKRESRRYVGDYILTQNDVRGGTIYEDTIAYGGWTMDDHNPQGFATPEKPNIFHDAPSPYAIPYRCLYSKNIDNLMFAGRNISTTHAALSSTRVMATCALLGQALGTAASIAAAHDCSPRDVYTNYIEDLKQTLIEDDCYLPGNRRKPPALMNKIKFFSPAGNIEALTDGVERMVDGVDHVWEADKGCEIIAEAAACVYMDQLRIVFDSDLNRKTLEDHREAIQKFPLRCQIFADEKDLLPPKTLVRKYEIWGDKGDGEWRLVFSEDNNYQRLARIGIRDSYQKIKLKWIETWGYAKIRIYGLDIR